MQSVTYKLVYLQILDKAAREKVQVSQPFGDFVFWWAFWWLHVLVDFGLSNFLVVDHFY